MVNNGEDLNIGFEGIISENYVNKTDRRPESYLSKEGEITGSFSIVYIYIRINYQLMVSKKLIE